jgi:hypothetical protein
MVWLAGCDGSPARLGEEDISWQPIQGSAPRTDGRKLPPSSLPLAFDSGNKPSHRDRPAHGGQTFSALSTRSPSPAHPVDGHPPGRSVVLSVPAIA